MGRKDEEGPKQPGAGGEDERRLSAAFLPYDDERLWVSMPAEDRGLRARLRRRRRGSEGAPDDIRPDAGADEPTVEQPVAGAPVEEPTVDDPIAGDGDDAASPARPSRRLVTIAAIVALPIIAFAITRSVGGDEPAPVPVVSSTPSLTPSPVVIDLTGFEATRVTVTRVVLAWQPLSVGSDLTYTIYRDGVAIWETSEPRFIDISIAPDTSYFYAVATALPDGTVASTAQLQVDVPSAAGVKPSPSPTAAPSRIVTAPPPSPSRTPSASPTPSKSKIVWPSIDLGGGSSPGGPTTPPPGP